MNVLLIFVVAFSIASALPVNAKVLIDSQTGCQITVPDGWKTFITPSTFPGFGARAYDPALYPAVDFSVDEETVLDPLTENSKFVEDFIKNVKSQGSVITRHEHRSINGREFLVLSLSTNNASGTNYMTAWFVVVKGHACQICLSAKGSDPNKNDALNGVIRSFSIPK